MREVSDKEFGNVIMGVAFGMLFFRWKRTDPFIAHTLLNSVAFIGYALLAGHVSGSHEPGRRALSYLLRGLTGSW